MQDEKYGSMSDAEYHFEYRIERVFGEKEIAKTPRLYFERDYRLPDLPYSMFAVAEEWLNRQETELAQLRGNNDGSDVRRVLAALPYDTVNIVYDIKGISCAPLADPNSEEYRAAEIRSTVTFRDFYGAGCRINIENNKSEDHSGIGVIDMLKNKKVVARFYFAVNFTFRKQIDYKLELAGDKLNLEFFCKDRPRGIAVVPVFNQDRLPCLRNDMGINRACEPFVLDFSNGPKCKCAVRLQGQATARGNIFSVGFADAQGAVPSDTASRYYLLDCSQNNTLPAAKVKLPQRTYSCPFCHKAIDYYEVRKDKRYRRGGAPCRGKDVKTDTPVLYNRHHMKLRHSMFCAEDLKQDDPSSFRPNRERLFPPDFLEHDALKIAFTGSARAGKTTYISRFFNITGGDKISMPMTMTINSMAGFGVSIREAPIGRAERASLGSYRIANTDWPDEQPEYTARSICLDPPRYPQQTPNGNYTEFPFIAEVNNRAYVSFYDIAGEDAQYSKQVKNIAGEDAIGIFCIVNGCTDVSGNEKVVNMLKSAELHRDCPVAVIVTKMDILESQFDANSHCLRSDYFGAGKYDGSFIEWEIDYVSEEIRSYLKQNGLLPDFTGVFDNVKYFGVSSFNFRDSIHEEMEDINAPGRVKFECSSKRMELPFLWMLRQFSVIK